ncbi:hypothetical protein JCM10207_000851 [Rhodosporidiobolus poonsookiae]
MASAASPPALPLSQLLTDHQATLTSLYTALSPAPDPLIAPHLDHLRLSLAALIEQQQQQATAELDAARERLTAGWRRVHDWQTALGEELRPAPDLERDSTPVLKLVEQVEAVKEGMKGRMEERGKRILQLHRRLRELREVVGREWVKVQVEEDGKGWEEMDLRLEKMGEMEREVLRCEAEIARRKDLISEHCGEIFTLRTELGISSPSSSPSASPAASSVTASTSGDSTADPLDEEILWHLGVGEKRQPRREMAPTAENVERVQAKRQWLEDEKLARNALIQTTYDQLYPLWTMLGVGEDEMEEFVNRWMGSTVDVVNAYQSELSRMLALKRTNLSAFIARERQSLTQLWDSLYLSHAQRLAQFPAYAISVEPARTTRWNAQMGCDEVEETVSDNVTEELLVAHERERERVERMVQEARPVLERLERYFEVVEKKRELEAAAADPSRLMDKSRGAAMRLAQEAKDRKRVDKEKPKLESDLRALIPQWEATNGRPFLVNGVSFIEGLDEQIRQEEEGRENRKRAKLAASSSGSSHSSSSARPLKAQHTGGSSLAHSTSASVAPLKRQMTGASTRSTTSAGSTGPPAAKRAATGPTPTGLARPRSRSVLGDAANTLGGGGGVAPAPLKAQATGRSAGPRSVPPTPAGGGGGMRIPAGWGAGAAAPSPVVTTVQPGAARLVPQATGGFRPRGGA